MLNNAVRQAIKDSVLCWLASVNKDGIPNVSPKEAFLAYAENEIIIANIASPNSIRNINQNPHVCASFVDVFKQKGVKIIGMARELVSNDLEYQERYLALREFVGEQYPIKSVIKVDIKSATPIVAPSYFLFAETTEEKQVEAALKTYGVRI